MLKTYLFVRRERSRKKASLYKQLFSITLDWQTIPYLLILAGYFIYAFVQVDEMPLFLQQINVHFVNLLQQKDNIIFGFSIVPILYVVQSFQRPGVLFSSSEFLLSILPHRRETIWLYSALERFIKYFFILVIVASGIYIFSSIVLAKIISYLFLLWIFMICLTFIQWKVFQLHIVWKFTLLILFSLFNSIYLLSGNLIFILLYGMTLIVILIFSLRNLFTNIDWHKVTVTSDFLIWNMALISHATKIKFKKDEQPGLWYQFKGWKERFPYAIEIAYNRIWYIYGEKQISVILQVTGGLFLLILVPSYFREIYFVIFVVVAIHIQTTFLISFFQDRLNSDLMNILPWNLSELRKTFTYWSMFVSIFLLIPSVFYAHYYFAKLSLVYVVFIMLLFYYTIHVKLQKYLHEIDCRYLFSETDEIAMYALFLLFVFSGKYPFLLLFAYVVLIALYSKQFKPSNMSMHT